MPYVECGILVSMLEMYLSGIWNYTEASLLAFHHFSV